MLDVLPAVVGRVGVVDAVDQQDVGVGEVGVDHRAAVVVGAGSRGRGGSAADGSGAEGQGDRRRGEDGAADSGPTTGEE